MCFPAERGRGKRDSWRTSNSRFRAGHPTLALGCGRTAIRFGGGLEDEFSQLGLRPRQTDTSLQPFPCGRHAALALAQRAQPGAVMPIPSSACSNIAPWRGTLVLRYGRPRIRAKVEL